MQKRMVLVLSIWLMLVSSVSATELVVNPDKQYVLDQADILSEEVEADLLTLATELKEKTGAEIFLLTVSDLAGYSTEKFTKQIFSEWEIGGKSQEDGLLLLLTSVNRAGSRLRIEVGSGLTETITTETARRILDEKMLPAVKEKDYNQAAQAGYHVVARELATQYEVTLSNLEENAGFFSDEAESSGMTWIQILIAVLVVFSFTSLGALGRRRGHQKPLNFFGNRQ